MDPTEPLAFEIDDGTDRIAIAALARACLEPERGGLAAVFLAGGVRAVEAHVRGEAGWVQLELAPGPGGFAPALYAALAQLVRALRGDGLADDAFFMHKPPGLRLRVHAAGDAAIAGPITARAEAWRRDGLIAAHAPAIYEPETHLFGGPASMPWVHRLFTCDAEAWLEHHAHAVPGRAWTLSLALLRLLHDALGVTDWEDVDVWDRIRARTGRHLPAAVTAGDDFAALAGEIRAQWHDPRGLLDDDPAASAIVARAAGPIAALGAGWQDAYLARPGARIGRRGLAALLTIFHWNRAGLPLARQALLAEALATRETV